MVNKLIAPKPRAEIVPSGYIRTPEARQMVRDLGIHATLPTLLSWCKRYGLGRLVAGRWYIDRVKLLRFLRGDQGAANAGKE